MFFFYFGTIMLMALIAVVPIIIVINMAQGAAILGTLVIGREGVISNSIGKC